MHLEMMTETVSKWMWSPSSAQPIRSPHMFTVFSADTDDASKPTARHFQSAVVAIMDFLQSFDMTRLRTTPLLVAVLLSPQLEADMIRHQHAAYFTAPVPTTFAKEYPVDIFAFVQLMRSRRLRGQVSLLPVLNVDQDLADPLTYPLTKEISPTPEARLLFRLEDGTLCTDLLTVIADAARPGSVVSVGFGTVRDPTLGSPVMHADARRDFTLPPQATMDNVRAMLGRLQDPRTLLLLTRAAHRQRQRRPTAARPLSQPQPQRRRRRTTGATRISKSILFGSEPVRDLAGWLGLTAHVMRPRDHALAQTIVRKELFKSAVFGEHMLAALFANSNVCPATLRMHVHIDMHGRARPHFFARGEEVSLEGFVEAIRACGRDRPVVVVLTVEVESILAEDAGGHMNVLLVQSGTMEHFEPHGSEYSGRIRLFSRVRSGDPELFARLQQRFPAARSFVTAIVGLCVEDTIATAIAAEYVPPSPLVCSVQVVERHTAGVHGGERYGLCVIWSFLYLFMRVAHPLMPDVRLQILAWARSFPMELPVAFLAVVVAAMPDANYHAVLRLVVGSN